MDREQRYKEIHEALKRACRFAHDHWAVWRQMWDFKATNNDEANYSPAFYQLSTRAHFNIFVVELTNLFGTARDSLSLYDLLKYVEGNSDLFEDSSCEESSDSLVKRDRARLDEASDTVKKVKTWRNKMIAHIDRKYLLNPGQVMEDQPVLVKEIEELLTLASGILDIYSVCYNGNWQEWETINVDDMAVLFSYAKRGKAALLEDRDSERKRLFSK